MRECQWGNRGGGANNSCCTWPECGHAQQLLEHSVAAGALAAVGHGWHDGRPHWRCSRRPQARRRGLAGARHCRGGRGAPQLHWAIRAASWQGQHASEPDRPAGAAASRISQPASSPAGHSAAIACSAAGVAGGAIGEASGAPSCLGELCSQLAGYPDQLSKRAI